jgi:hypothetical protein
VQGIACIGTVVFVAFARIHAEGDEEGDSD